MEFLRLMETPALRVSAWTYARGIVLDWRKMALERGRLQDARHGIPHGDQVWNVEVDELIGHRGRVSITDGTTVSEFW